MRRIYLIRHGQPFFPNGDKYCIGITDFPLSPLGRMQACVLGRSLKDETLRVFSSPLKRALETASFICSEPIVIDELKEMHAGDWEGLCFKDIMERWPGLFEARGADGNIPIPNAEDWHEGQQRFLRGFHKALEGSEGDIAIVAHTTVILSLICHIMADMEYKHIRWRQDCGSFYLLEEDKGAFRCLFPWERPVPQLDNELCEELLSAVKLPEHIRAHSRAVAAEAEAIAHELQSAGVELNLDDLRHAALLHDIARLEEDHPRLASERLRDIGFDHIASIVSQHHDLESSEIDESALLYIADKLIIEDKKCSLRERFQNSRNKCRSEEALRAHERRRLQAFGIADKINKLCNREVIT